MKTKRLFNKLCAAALSVLMAAGTATAAAGSIAMTSLPVYADGYVTPDTSFSYVTQSSGGKTEVTIMSFKGSETNVVIPAYINNKPVTTISSGAFRDNTSIVSVTIPETVDDIDSHVFNGCTSLAEINVPDSVGEIGYRAFYNTAWLNNQPDGDVYAGKMYYCYKGTMPANTSITVKDGTFGIADDAFYNQKGLVCVTLPDGLYRVGSWAFEECTNLQAVFAPDSFKAFGYQMFKGCPDVTIYGHKGTSIEFYANTMKIPFSTDTMPATNISSVSEDGIVLGKTVTVNCEAIGGTGKYTYAVYYRKAGSAKWTTAQNYKENKTVTVKPKAAVDYEIKVSVKDISGTVDDKEFTIKVVKPLSNTSKLGAETIKLGEKVKVRCFATGGFEPYEFAVYYKKSTSEKWSKLRGYDTANIVMLTPKAAFSYDVRVYAKDASGKTSAKTLTLNVTK